MSNNIYNILSNFNKVAQEAQTPAAPVAKAKTKLQESVEGVLSEKYMGFKKTAAAVKKAGSAENPEAVAAAIGRKKYGKEKFQQAAAAGKKLGEERVDSPTIKGTDKKAKSVYVPPAKPPVAKLAKPIDEAKPDFLDVDKDGDKKEPMKKALKDKKKSVAEVAPPGKKAERMVKHIKKGYAKDGKVTDKEKSIAYATAWKAHNKGKVEEAIKAMFEAGYTKEQIVEGWEDMLKSVEKSRKDEKGTGKFDKKKSDKGTVYTRKYNAKTGEADDTENVTKEKRGRGRPKKSAFEGKYASASKMLKEEYSFIEGRIEGGVWVDKPGNVPVPQNPEVAPAAPKTGIAGKAAQDLMKSSDPNAYNKMTGTAVKGKPVKAVTDPEGVKEEEMQEALNQMRRIAGLPVLEAEKKADKDYDGDGKVESGKDEYQGSKIAAAKKAADDKIDECVSAMGNGMMGQEAAGKMNISTNMSSDGNKSVTITADGDAALDLMQMLKLAGMQGAEAPMQEPEQEPTGVMVVSTDDEGSDNEEADADSEEEVDEEKDERYHANTTPDEHVEPVQAQTKGGNGDVAGQEKKMRSGGYQFGDNNLAMKDVNEGIAGLEAMGRKLYKEYESIKVQK